MRPRVGHFSDKRYPKSSQTADKTRKNISNMFIRTAATPEIVDNGPSQNVRIAKLVRYLSHAIKQKNCSGHSPALATRTSQRARQEFKQNRFVIIAAGGLVFALLILAFASAPKFKRGIRYVSNARPTAQATTAQSTATTPANESLLPVMDSGRPTPAETHDGELTEQDLDRTATRRATKVYSPPSTGEVGAQGSLGSIPPFGEQPWQAPPYQPGMSPNAGTRHTTPSHYEFRSLILASNRGDHAWS